MEKEAGREVKPGKRKWRCGVSIPVPLACKASALPSELHPLHNRVCMSVVSLEKSRGEKKKEWRCGVSIPVPLAC